MRLKDKIALIFGAGQALGETPAIGNGRAVSLLFAREGAKVVCVDRRADAWDVTYAALFLASDEAKFITGAALPVDGGRSCLVG